MKKYLLLALSIIFTNFISVAKADDWPQFRGFGRTGISAETGLLTQWPQDGPELLWQADGLGIGWSSACVVDDKVYIAGMDPQSKIGSVFAFDSEGKKLWQTAYGPEWDKSYPGCRNTPTYSSQRIYFNSGLETVSCFDQEDGKLLWSVNTAEICGTKFGRWGNTCSPLLYDEMVITSPGGSNAGLIALNAENGAVVWKTDDFTESAVYCSPVLISHNGLDMIIAVMSESIAAFEAKTGKVIWKVPHAQYEPAGRAPGARANCPIYADGRIFVTSGYDKGAVMLELSHDGRQVTILGSVAEFDTHFGGAVRIDNYIYGSNTDRPANKWLCLNFNDGTIVYAHDWDKGKGAVIAADGHLYCYNEQTGAVALVKADPAGFNIVSQFTISGGSGEHWAHPSISNGKLYIHRGDSLFVYKIK